MTVTDPITTGLNVRLTCVHGNAIVAVGSFGNVIPTSPSRALTFDGVDGISTQVFPAPGSDISAAMFVSRDTSHPFSMTQHLDNGWFAELTGTGASSFPAGSCTFAYHLHVARA